MSRFISEFFHVQKLVRFASYSIAPLMVLSIGWLTNEFAQTITTSVPKGISGYGLFIAFTLLCALLSFILFCVNVLTNLSADMQGELSQTTGNTIRRVAVFFAFTVLVGLTINILNSLLSDALKIHIENPNTLFFTTLAIGVLFFSDLHNSDYKKVRACYWPAHLKFFGTLFLLLSVVNLAIATHQDKVSASIVYINITFIMLYSVVLFFEILAKFVKPQNKLVEEELSGKRCLITFLSSMRKDEDKQWHSISRSLVSKRTPIHSITYFSEFFQINLKFFSKLASKYNDILINETKATESKGTPIQQVLDKIESDDKATVKMVKQVTQFKTENDMENTYAYFHTRLDANNIRCNKIVSLNQMANEIALLFNRHPWEMTLRGIQHHIDKNTLSEIVIIASSGGDGSANSVCCLLRCLQMFFDHLGIKVPIKVGIENPDAEKAEARFDLLTIDDPDSFDISGYSGIDFGSFQKTSDAVMGFLKHPEILKHGLHNVVLDVTGGQKTTSVAAALVATVTDVINQYVDTNSKKVKGYDFKYVDPTKTY